MSRHVDEDMWAALRDLFHETMLQQNNSKPVEAAIERVHVEMRRYNIRRGLARLGHQPECVSVGCHDAHCHCGSCLEVRLNDSY